MIEFDELAGGRGEIGSRLRAGQRSKRLLQIVAMLKEMSVRCPDAAAAGHFVASYAALADIRRRSPAAVDGLLLHPQVGAWAAAALRRLMSPGPDDGSLEDDLGHLGAITAAAALGAAEGFELTLRIRADGTLMLPTFGLVRLEAASAWCRARARPGAQGIELDLGDGVVAVPIHSRVSSSSWWPLRRLASATGECRIEVALDDIDPYRDSREIGARSRLSIEEASDWQARLDEAWGLLCRGHRRWAGPLATGVTVLVPLHAPPQAVELGRATGLSATTNDACGAVGLSRPPDGVTLAATLVHEFQHSKLAALLDLVSLYDADAEAVYYAPWRVDPRPLHGLLHGTYAYLALVDFWRKHRSTPGAEGRVAQFEFARWRRAVSHTLRTIRESRRLTEAGDRFVGGMHARLSQWRSLRVAPEAERFARDARSDHLTSWRLRNLRPDPDEIAVWADAWLTGVGRPPVWPQVTVVDGDPWSGTDARLGLTYLRLRDPDYFERLCGDSARLSTELPDVTPADLRYAGADYGSALRLYNVAVAAAPEGVDSWAGLALASRRLSTATGRVLATRPETVLALHRHVHAITGLSPDIDALSRWLADEDTLPAL